MKFLNCAQYTEIHKSVEKSIVRNDFTLALPLPLAAHASFVVVHWCIWKSLKILITKRVGGWTITIGSVYVAEKRFVSQFCKLYKITKVFLGRKRSACKTDRLSSMVDSNIYEQNNGRNRWICIFCLKSLDNESILSTVSSACQFSEI